MFKTGKLFRCFSFATVLVSALSDTRPAAALECPHSVAYIENNILAEAVLPLFQHIYSDLGCSATDMIALPAKRAIREFNRGYIDGEVYRLPVYEKRLKRDFIRSSVPIFTAENAVWHHPDPAVRAGFPLGYIRGVVFAEEYLANKKNRAFDSTAELADAYQRGKLSGFLLNDFVVGKLTASGLLVPEPVKGEFLAHSKFYHYLKKNYAPFMEAFSQHIKDYHPLSEIEKIDPNFKH